MSEFPTNMHAYLPQHTALRLKVKALKARVHCVCRRYSTIETETDNWKLMKGGMNSHDVDERIVYLAYIITAHTTHCMDIYNLQHIILYYTLHVF